MGIREALCVCYSNLGLFGADEYPPLSSCANYRKYMKVIPWGSKSLIPDLSRLVCLKRERFGHMVVH